MTSSFVHDYKFCYSHNSQLCVSKLEYLKKAQLKGVSHCGVVPGENNIVSDRVNGQFVDWSICRLQALENLRLHCWYTKAK